MTDILTSDSVASVSLTDADRNPQAFAQELGQSFVDYGFAIVRDHGISQDLIERAEAKAKEFFALPDAVKRNYLIPGGGGARGYTAFGVETAKGFIAAKKVAVSAAGHTSVVMETAGVRLPLESYPLQALVSEPIKPIFPCVVMSNAVHAYISQSDKGELVIGSGTDQYVSYSQRGGLPLIEHTLAAICEIFPIFRRMRMLRKWGGIVDVTPDRSAILGKTRDLGTIEAGKLADIIVVNGNPLYDITALAHVETVVKGGVVSKGAAPAPARGTATAARP